MADQSVALEGDMGDGVVLKGWLCGRGEERVGKRRCCADGQRRRLDATAAI